MTEQKDIVTDDWTSNWQANIAVKITAIVLWVVILVAFLSMLVFVVNRASGLREDFKEHLDGFESKINEYVGSEKSINMEKLLSRVASEKDAWFEYTTIKLAVAGETRFIGEIPKDEEHVILDFASHRESMPNAAGAIQVTVYHEPFRVMALKNGENIVLAAGLAILLFGLLLTWIIHQVLSKPLQILINATKLVGDGNLNTRIDFIGRDEFGQLSEFFNKMLIRLGQQQEELLTSNEQLKRENAVRLDVERALLLHRDHLEKVVIERTADLAVARDDALRASQTKSEFLANMSHEVRTPLTAIIGFGEAILDGRQTEAEKQDAVRTVIRNGRHLLTIINDILDMSKMEAGKLEVEKIALSPFHLMADIESLVGMQARDKGLNFSVDFEFPLPEIIASDPTRLKQILLNLCANALKFTKQGSVHVVVSCKVEMQQMMFAVVDTGIGLSVSAQERMFKPFSQADTSTTRKFGGTGLGLYISQRLAQMLGGDIRVESTEGVGSKFVVMVDTGPIDREKMVDRIEMVGRAEPLSITQTTQAVLHGKVLVAEDSTDNQKLISIYLRRAGKIDFTMVENGSLAVEQALSGDYDLILMDMQMPVMGGLEAVTLLRGAGYSGPIIALTANAMKEEQESYIAAGCNGFLSKPIDQQKFFLALAEFLKDSADGEQQDDELESSDDELAELTRGFVKGLPRYRAELVAAMSESAWVAAKAVAHKLKGMGGSFGCPEITRLAGLLEASLKNGDTDNVGSQYSQLLIEIDRVCAA